MKLNFFFLILDFVIFYSLITIRARIVFGRKKTIELYKTKLSKANNKEKKNKDEEENLI